MNIIPDTLSRLFNFEHSEMGVAPHLTPICRNVPDNPALHGPPRLRPYQVNSHNLDEIQPVESDRERFTSATDVFMSIDPEKLRQAQQAEFGPYFEHLCDPKKRPPSNESRTSMSYYSENGGLLYRSYLPGHPRKRSTFRDQLVIPSACIPMVLHACHDHAMSGGHLAYKHTFDKVRDRFWWPTLHRDVKTWCQDCQACQRRKTPHHGPKLPTGHLPVDRPFQCVSIDLVEYKTESVSPAGLKCSYRYSGWCEIHHRVRHTECLLANTHSEDGLSQNNIWNLERQVRFQGPTLWHRECTLDIPTCHVPCVRQFWPTEWLVGIYGRCHCVFCDVGSSPQIIRGYVSRPSNSRPDIATIQN